jgi:hypothetical protein
MEVDQYGDSIESMADSLFGLGKGQLLAKISEYISLIRFLVPYQDIFLEPYD